ncbi:MBL fold metallo-hydrolase [Brevibacillus migulae]|uniref:MBL fold metallo-hydrolase n=1 Tax=Brevibacillus migulae TaxID=1644114 RepID=UPI00106E8337|nr:MBL fold metallo-hydrolase [Brevibacillus migulae]
MRITILGCQSPYPGPDGATAGYLVQTATTNLLLDCGSGVISQLGKELPIYKLDAVVLSHYHHDHIADVGVLQYGIMVHQNVKDRDANHPVPIYGPAEPADRAESLTYRDATRFFPVDEHSHIEIGDMKLSFLRTEHDVPCYAVRIEANGKTFVYGADSGPTTKWEPFARQADLFICEGTFLRKYYTPKELNGHLTVELAAQAGQQLQVKKLVITHLFHAYKEEDILEEAKSYTYGECLVAKEGMQIVL